MSDFRKYGPDEAAAAAGIGRATLHSWMARKALGPAAPGRGKARAFSYTEVVRLAVVVRLVRLGVTIGYAAPAAEQIEGDLARGLFLVLWPVPGHVNPDLGGPMFQCIEAKSLTELGPKLWMYEPKGHFDALAVVDVSLVARQVRETLSDQK